MRYRLAVFDFDGTLVERHFAFEATRSVFNSFGVSPPTEDDFFENILPDVLRFYHDRGIPSHLTLEDLYIPWLDFQRENLHRLVLREGAKQVLEELRKSGAHVAIGSNALLSSLLS